MAAECSLYRYAVRHATSMYLYVFDITHFSPTRLDPLRYRCNSPPFPPAYNIVPLHKDGT